MRRALIAIGGNSLLRAGETATVDAERAHVADVARAIAAIVADGWRVIVTHGNGPQVGAELLRSERATGEAYPLPLDVCVACTQGEIGFLLQQALGAALAAEQLRRPAVTLLTQVVVSAGDPAFSRPTKPIGPYYDAAQAEICRASGWSLVQVPGRGFRRVVPSPEPIRIVEETAIRALVDSGAVVVALGGGGIPVVPTRRGLRGVEAVIDKDLASALLATSLGVDRFVIATDVDRIYTDFGRPSACALDTISAEALRRLAREGQFPAGSMGPKVEAALRFVGAGGDEAIIASHEGLVAALDGRGGTHVTVAGDRGAALAAAEPAHAHSRGHS
jgi:carbamate kinase